MTYRERFQRLPGNVRGAAWLVLGGLCWTVVTILIKLLGQRLEALQVAFFRGVFGLIFIVPLLIRFSFAPLRSARHVGHFWRAALGTTSMALGFYAVTHLPLADATSIGFTTPLFVLVVAALFLGEKVRWRRWSATAVGFVGVVVMMRPGQAAFDPVMLLALAGAALTAGAVSVVKNLTATESTMTMLATFTLWSTAFMTVPAILVWRAPTLAEWGLAAAMGALATIGQSFIIRAYGAGDASAVAPFDYLRLPLSVLAGLWMFAEPVSWWTLGGAAVIVAATLYIARREARLGIKVAPEVKSGKIGP